MTFPAKSIEADSTLLVILANPPLGTTGLRTLNRVSQASAIFGSEKALITNLLSVPTRSTSDIREVGGDPEGWRLSRADIQEKVALAGHIIYAFGVSEPSGPARINFRDQLGWLSTLVARRHGMVWTVGPTPRHPSRWHRFTSRAHPGLDVPTALALSFVSSPVQAFAASA